MKDKEPWATNRELDVGGYVGIMLAAFPAAISAPHPIITLVLMAIVVVFGYRAYQGYKLEERLEWPRVGLITTVSFFSIILFLQIMTIGFK